MALQIGLVGLPNAGKSTLFNALSQRRLAQTAPRAFTTIDPNEAVVDIPDENLDTLCELIGPERCINSSIKFIDIAGLIKDAHKGEGLGNQFLAKIREVDAILHVVRAFTNDDISHSHPSHEPGSLEQIIEDIEIVNLELELGEIVGKPTLYLLNISENMDRDKIDFINNTVQEKFGSTVALSAKLEEDFIDLEQKEKEQYLMDLKLGQSGLKKLISASYELLELISFYTIKGGKEVHAWALKKGDSAHEAAEIVHTDFAKNFIRAEVIGVEELLELGSWKSAREKGKIRTVGKDYVVQDKEVIEFLVSK